jgi:flagellar biosynthesis chaperone FliJ
MNESVTIYTSSIGDLGTALNMKLLQEAKEMKDTVQGVSQQIKDMSVSSEAYFQSLQHQTSVGMDRLFQENLGKFPLTQL